jgi:hypothetical protein
MDIEYRKLQEPKQKVQLAGRPGAIIGHANTASGSGGTQNGDMGGWNAPLIPKVPTIPDRRPPRRDETILAPKEPTIPVRKPSKSQPDNHPDPAEAYFNYGKEKETDRQNRNREMGHNMGSWLWNVLRGNPGLGYNDDL